MTWPAGKFLGDPPLLRIMPFVPSGNGRSYIFDPTLGSFSFQRASGEVVTLDRLETDGGTIPKFLWSLPFLHLDPWTFMWSFMFHDMRYVWHHADDPRAGTLLDTNNLLAEAITTEIQEHDAPGTERDVQLIFDAVNGLPGQIAWKHGTTLNWWEWIKGKLP